MKTAIYATLVGLLNVSHANVVNDLLEDLFAATRDAFKLGNWTNVKLLVRLSRAQGFALLLTQAAIALDAFFCLSRSCQHHRACFFGVLSQVFSLPACATA